MFCIVFCVLVVFCSIQNMPVIQSSSYYGSIVPFVFWSACARSVQPVFFLWDCCLCQTFLQSNVFTCSFTWDPYVFRLTSCIFALCVNFSEYWLPFSFLLAFSDPPVQGQLSFAHCILLALQHQM